MKNSGTMPGKLGRALQITLATLLLAGCACGRHDAERNGATRVLFIGNSFTFYHDMPTMFAELARASGHEVMVEVEAPSGQTLSVHAVSATTPERIASGDWDYVVLQEHSAMSIEQKTREEQMFPAARALDQMIRESGGRTILFMTWGYRDGLPDKGFPDFASMQAELNAGYVEIADQLGAIVAPVGIAWQNGLAQESQLDLWDPDGGHPSETGSYLTACVFYATIYRKSPEGLSYQAGLPETTARLLQTVAAETVLADPQRWNINNADTQQ